MEATAVASQSDEAEHRPSQEGSLRSLVDKKRPAITVVLGFEPYMVVDMEGRHVVLASSEAPPNSGQLAGLKGFIGKKRAYPPGTDRTLELFYVEAADFRALVAEL